ncbi:LysR family transcriptional regulator [Allosphingosinicella deserti]|uniref:LysR family transcriptional regulator n=1 Tax=Allosphingosinicella deserti TaxID=2116704 RepID=A0A2P7QZQ8_9SPHN|nr:LysR family transcriptional regulator [Sphingomonas deserti]PSJ43439.1 LysR family transcriptional regulator [Sphingomonas deserti]
MSSINPDRLSLTTLRLLVAVAEEGSLSKASVRESIATSAASKRLSDLELALNTSLFNRNAQGMTLTPAGESMIQHARRILLAAATLAAEMSEYREGVRGHVRILAHLSAIIAFLPEDLERFFIAHSDLKVELEERPSSRVMKGIAEGWADLGICSADAEQPGLVATTYRRDRLVLAMRQDHPLAGTGPLAFADTLSFDHIGLHAESSIFTRSLIAAREASQVLRRRIHVPGFDAVCRTVQSNLGIALIPEPVFRILGPSMNLHYEELADDWARREIVIVRRGDQQLSAAAQLLLAHLLSADQRIGDDRPSS